MNENALKAIALPFLAWLMVALGLYQLFAYGFVLSRVWAWHVGPVLPWILVPAPSWKVWAGVCLCYRLIRGLPERSSDEPTWAWFLVGVAYPWLLLVIAWVFR